MESSDYREVRARERDPTEDWGDGFACAKPEPPGPTVYRIVRSDFQSVGSTTHALLHVRRSCVGKPMFPVDSPVSHGSFACANDSGDPWMGPMGSPNDFRSLRHLSGVGGGFELFLALSF